MGAVPLLVAEEDERDVEELIEPAAALVLDARCVGFGAYTRDRRGSSSSRSGSAKRTAGRMEAEREPESLAIQRAARSRRRRPVSLPKAWVRRAAAWCW